MRVTLATTEDIPELCELLAILFSQEAEFTSDPIKQAKGLETILADNSIGLILVLKEEGKVIGMVNLLFTVSTFLGAKVALLEDMVIRPAHRGKGGGTLLLRAAMQNASERGCRRITLLTDGSNTPAREFYAKMGFVESAMVPYRLILPE
jgi:GNAT superfamily N-acetyltransferase